MTKPGAYIAWTCPDCGFTNRGRTNCPRCERGRPTTSASAQALEDATIPVAEPMQNELVNEDGFDV